ncbi:MAG: aggregation factor core [Boseongicola sp.]|nr:aggregation factor core [Boseongicola sp.]
MCSANTAHADLSVRFVEGAPKDSFRIENTGTCDIAASTLRLDLSASQGALIFDVTDTGAGVEVFQPFEMVDGSTALNSIPTVLDGQSAIDLDIKTLAPGAVISFTIDVDDTVGQREITVSGSEIAGAMVSLERGRLLSTATFSSAARADIVFEDC